MKFYRSVIALATIVASVCCLPRDQTDVKAELKKARAQLQDMEDTLKDIISEVEMKKPDGDGDTKNDENEDWTLVAKEKDCGGGGAKWMNKLPSLAACSAACRGIASMFTYGTTYYWPWPCNNKEGCVCRCETNASADGTCNMVHSYTWDLYKYKDAKRDATADDNVTDDEADGNDVNEKVA